MRIGTYYAYRNRIFESLTTGGRWFARLVFRAGRCVDANCDPLQCKKVISDISTLYIRCVEQYSGHLFR